MAPTSPSRSPAWRTSPTAARPCARWWTRTPGPPWSACRCCGPRTPPPPPTAHTWAWRRRRRGRRCARPGRSTRWPPEPAEASLDHLGQLPQPPVDPQLGQAAPADRADAADRHAELLGDLLVARRRLGEQRAHQRAVARGQEGQRPRDLGLARRRVELGAGRAVARVWDVGAQLVIGRLLAPGALEHAQALVARRGG